MAIDTIDVGTSPNDGTGDAVRDAFVKVNGNFSQVLLVSGGTMTGALILSADPSAALHAATKQYVDAVASGLDPKAAVRAATTANITLSGTQTVDDVSLSTGDRVLVKNQSTGSENGIYVVAAGSWARSSDADADAEVTSGMYTIVTEGTENGKKGFVLTTGDPITVGTTALTFELYSDPTGLIDELKKRTRGTNSKSADYQLVADDAGKTVVLTGSTGRIFTIDAATFAGDDQGLIRQHGTGQITIAAGGSTSLRYHSEFVAKTKGQWSWIAWERISTTEISLTGHMELA